MRHPPGMTRALALLLSLVAVVVMAPASPGHAYSTEASPTFYARMLDRHDGVYVSEELAGYMDRPVVAADLRARVDEAAVDLDVLVVAHPTDEDMRALTDAVVYYGERSLVVFSPNTNHVGLTIVKYSGLPVEVAAYTTYTGAYPEDPRDQLDRMLRAADYPDLEERTAKAQSEYVELVGGTPEPDAAPPGLFPQRWLVRTWPSTVGAAVTMVGVALIVVVGVTILRRRREGVS